MKLLFSMPGGAEWILILMVISGPIFLIYYLTKNKKEKK